MNALIKSYLAEIKETRSPQTWVNYGERLKRFSDYIKDSTFDRQVATAFLLYLKKKDFGQASVSLHQATLKSFYSWLCLNGHATQNWLAVNPINPYYSPKRSDDFAFTEEEYGRIKAHCLTMNSFWHDAVVCAWNTGLRLRDIAYLSREHIDVRGQRIALVPGKTARFGKSIEIPILPELKEMIERNNCAPFLFPLMAKSYNQSGNKALSVGFGRILKALNIDGKSFHSFRHRMTSVLLNSGTPLSVVSSITGQTLQTLQRYSHVGFDQKKLAMEKMCAA